MAGIPDIDAHKIYIGQENPRDDRSILTIKPSDKGPAPFDGTLAVQGPSFFGGHSPLAIGVMNVGAPGLAGFIPKLPTVAIHAEGDLHVTGKSPIAVNILGNTNQKGNITATGTILGGSVRDVGGNVLASKKDFDIPHPNIEGHRLRHTCVEGPEAAIYVRGKVSIDGIIELPDYWQNFVDKESISVHLTPKGAYQELFVDRIEYGKRVYIKNQAGGKIDAYYQVWADRAGEKLIVEYKGNSAADYPGDQSDHSVAGYNYDIRSDVKDDGTWFTSDV